MSDLNLYSVNWQDGMLISQQHLKDQERYFEDLARWYALSAGNHWGLVRKSVSGQPALVMNHSLSSGQLRVELLRCQALTPGGAYIEINESSRNAAIAEARVSDGPVTVFVSIAPDAKRQVGDPDPQEEVPRVPYLASSYAVHLGTPPSMPEEWFVPVAELMIAGSEVAPSETYYPPCLSISADDRLGQKATDLRNRLENLLSLTSRAYTAIATAGALSSESSSLQVAFKETVYHLAYHLSSTLDECLTGRNGGHPAELVIVFKKLFRVVSTLLNLQPGLKDYLNEKLFIKQMGTEVARFLSEVDAFLLADYDHRNLGSQIKMIDDTMGTLRSVFGFLAQLKSEQLGPQAVTTDTLTYAGKTYRIVEYGGCAVEQVGELAYVSVGLSSPQPVSDAVTLMAKDLFSVAEWNNMQVRLGLNEARGLGETDPVDVDTTSYGDKVALHAQDMLKSPSVNQLTLIFRGARDMEKLQSLSKSELTLYAV